MLLVCNVKDYTATGGVINDYTDGSDVYRAHVFTSSGTFHVTGTGDFGNNIDFLVVGGGGGGGGGDNGGGGGAGGGLRTNLLLDHFTTSSSSWHTNINFVGSYTVTVGGVDFLVKIIMAQWR